MEEKRSPPYGNTFLYDPTNFEDRSEPKQLTSEEIDFWENKLDTVMIQINGKKIIFRRTAY